MSLETFFVKNSVQMVVSQPLRPPPRMAPVEMVLLKQRIQIIVHNALSIVAFNALSKIREVTKHL